MEKVTLFDEGFRNLIYTTSLHDADTPGIGHFIREITAQARTEMKQLGLHQLKISIEVSNLRLRGLEKMQMVETYFSNLGFKVDRLADYQKEVTKLTRMSIPPDAHLRFPEIYYSTVLRNNNFDLEKSIWSIDQ
jgi:ABC-type anion transport system duplicated permease subunit